MAEIPFPSGAVDGTTFFHEDKVCVYHGASNTWECRKVSSDTPTPTNTVYTTDVFTAADTAGNSLREFAQNKLSERSVNFDVPAIRNQYDANHALVEMIAAVAVGQPDGPSIDPDLYATRLWVQDHYAPLVHVHGEYATTGYVDAAVENITIPSLDGYATQMWVSQNYSASSHGHSQYVTNNTLNTKLGGYATSQELEVASNNIDLKSSDGLSFFKSTTGTNNARSNLKYYGDTSDHYNIVTRYTVESMLGAYATKAEIPDTSSFITSSYLEQRIGSITIPQLPSDLITAHELETRLDGLPDVDLSNYTTRQDFTALTGTISAAVNQVAANVADKATQHDVQLAAHSVDAKFDMLRSAIREAVDFDTLKVRLLAVLE